MCVWGCVLDLRSSGVLTPGLVIFCCVSFCRGGDSRNVQWFEDVLGCPLRCIECESAFMAIRVSPQVAAT